jgi:hypothetical protein
MADQRPEPGIDIWLMLVEREHDWALTDIHTGMLHATFTTVEQGIAEILDACDPPTTATRTATAAPSPAPTGAARPPATRA